MLEYYKDKHGQVYTILQINSSFLMAWFGQRLPPITLAGGQVVTHKWLVDGGFTKLGIK